MMKIFRYLGVGEKQRTLLVVLIIVVIVLSLYNSQLVTVRAYIPQCKDTNDDTSNYDRYIIKFNEEPLSSFKHRFKEKMENVFSRLNRKFVDKISNQMVLQFKNKILSLHSRAKDDILQLVNSDSEEIFSGEFIVLFNGIVIKKVPDRVLEMIRSLPYVENVFPDHKIIATLDYSVPLINADDVWDLSDAHGRNVTGKGVTIAILDTGVDYNHLDLKDNFVGGYDFVNGDDDPMDDNGHGTHVAGIAVGSGNASNYTFVGVAPDAEFYAYKVMDSKGEGYSSWFISSMEQAVSDNVDIISISAGDSSGHPDDALSMAADNAVSLGVVVVAAAGNDGPSEGTVSSPGAARRVICVGATDKDDKISSSSSRGPTSIGTVKPDVVAPGVDIVAPRAAGTSWGSIVDEYYTRGRGTSMAAPHVAGTAALIKQMHPDWTAEEIKMALRNTAVDLREDLNTQGYGRIDAFNAVNLSDAPPISILETSGEIDRGLVDIYGTASADDFQNYSLYYRQDGDWIKLYNRSSEVIDNVLFIWDTRLLDGGNYELKLEVRSPNQTSVDIIFITLKHRGDELLIESPDSVDEFRRFTVNVKDINGMPRGAWVLFTLPYHRPRLRYGSSVAFRAPLILNRRIESLEGKITVFKIFGDYSGGEKRITVINNKLISS